jgi:hypothetical protein
MVIASGATSPRIAVQPRSSSGGIALVAVYECRCSVEFGVKATGANGAEQAARAVVGPRTEQVLLEVTAPPGTGEIRFDYGYVIGDPAASHDPPGPYRAPFAAARSFPVTQAPPDATAWPAAVRQRWSACFACSCARSGTLVLPHSPLGRPIR